MKKPSAKMAQMNQEWIASYPDVSLDPYDFRLAFEGAMRVLSLDQIQTVARRLEREWMSAGRFL